MKSTLPLIAALSMSIAMPAFAEGPTPPTSNPTVQRAPQGDRWQNASPEQREKMKAHHEARKQRWENATPEEREKMKQRKTQMQEKWKNASPEERESMKARHGEMKQRFENASPEEREQMRLRHEEMRRKWQNASPEERESHKDRSAIGQGGQPHFNTPVLNPVSTEGGVSELPRRHQAR